MLQVPIQSPFTDFMATVGATKNLHMTMPSALKARVRMPGVAGLGSFEFAFICAYIYMIDGDQHL